jgi:hypothetical protein
LLRASELVNENYCAPYFTDTWRPAASDDPFVNLFKDFNVFKVL